MSESTKRRMRRGQAEWRRLIDEQADSGQIHPAFCAANGISVGSLQNGKRRLAAGVSPAPWLELGTLAQQGTSAWDIELDLGDGVCLRLRRCIDLRSSRRFKCYQYPDGRSDLYNPWPSE